MSRRTLKYTRALEIESEFTHLSSNELYNYLQNKGYFWDSNMSRWVYTPGEQNDPASQLIKIRVWYDKKHHNYFSITILLSRLLPMKINTHPIFKWTITCFYLTCF